ncbi:hypothetical protein B0H66DRAFT_638709 [Apodospora peruviana]|uniref:Uncharacterized protein n=1 Tax=Apodospora peruviana TaxID=516989 RepID=A0AAE0IBS1_9PEZI|nr:hypothetical protein B0H66DRAFT_638709 [Apodospora peruviana]
MTQQTLARVREREPTPTKSCPALPQEIWWLVAQELSNRLDFSGLFLCACINRGLASLALPLLYSIHESSPASNAHILDIGTSVGLWRSIISSSLGETLFPYCHWVKTLRLGDLYSLLEDLGRDSVADLRAHFFSPPLQKLRILSGRRRGLNLDAIVIEVANKVTECIRTAADQQEKAVGLTSLEGPHLPSANLPGWVTRLSRLTSLTVRDGSVLNSQVAQAIRENCPAFKEVTCYWCQGSDIDVQLAGFFNGLGSNTLEAFTVNSLNMVGEETFKALSGHGLALKRLGLFSLNRAAFGSLNHLNACLALEKLILEAASDATQLQWEGPLKDVYSQVVHWLESCVCLEELDFQRIPQGTEMLSEVLKAPSVRLTSLHVKTDDLNPGLYESLRCQNSLLQLNVRIVDEDVLDAGEVGRCDQFVDAICHCRQLRVVESNELLTISQLTQLTTALPTLEVFDLNGNLIDDCFLLPLSTLSFLKSLTVFGPSDFTFDGIMEFFDNLGSDLDARHEGFQLYVANQNSEFKFSAAEEVMLADEIRIRFNGKVDINYRADPDELHESDFSD